MPWKVAGLKDAKLRRLFGATQLKCRHRRLPYVHCTSEINPQTGAGRLSGIRVVLVSPKYPGNVGSVCRLCDCFEAPDIVLVDSRCDVDDDQVKRLAVDKPDIDSPSLSLGRIREVATLQDAVADATSSVAFTRRLGNLRRPYRSVNHLLEENAGLLGERKEGKLALVFGREESGLTTEEVNQCSLACQIPTGNFQPSLNLSHAVGIALAPLFEAATSGHVSTRATPNEAGQKRGLELELATGQDINNLIGRWTQVVSAVGMETQETEGGGAHGKKRKILGHLRAILLRAETTDKEARALHGLCSAILHELLRHPG